MGLKDMSLDSLISYLKIYLANMTDYVCRSLTVIVQLIQLSEMIADNSLQMMDTIRLMIMKCLKEVYDNEDLIDKIQDLVFAVTEGDRLLDFLDDLEDCRLTEVMVNLEDLYHMWSQLIVRHIQRTAT